MENCKKRGGKKARGEITHALSHSPPLLDRSCKQVSSIKMAKQKTSPFLPVSPLALSLSPCVSIPHVSAGARRRRRRRGIKVSSPPFRAVKLAGPKGGRKGRRGADCFCLLLTGGGGGDGHPRRKTVFGKKRDEISEFTFPKCREKETFFRFCRGIRNNIFPEERERGQ